MAVPALDNLPSQAHNFKHRVQNNPGFFKKPNPVVLGGLIGFGVLLAFLDKQEK